MKTYKLMIKIHKITKLKYLCVTTKNSWRTYKGSGTYWKNHLRFHGNHIRTFLILESKSIEEISILGLYYSEKYDIVNSDAWANLIPENGYGTNPNVWKNGIINYKNKVGIHSEKYDKGIRSHWAKLGGLQGGKNTKKLKVGIFSEKYNRSKQSKINYSLGLGKLSEEERRNNCKLGGIKTKQNNLGIFAASAQQRKIWATTNGSLGGIKCKENNLGFFSASKEEKIEWSKKGGKISGKITGKMYWWNNGQINTKSFECPGVGWKRGQIESEKKKLSRENNLKKAREKNKTLFWYNNGVINKRFDLNEFPDGFVRGRINVRGNIL